MLSDGPLRYGKRMYSDPAAAMVLLAKLPALLALLVVLFGPRRAAGATVEAFELKNDELIDRGVEVAIKLL